jgi:hypothetical protein
MKTKEISSKYKQTESMVLENLFLKPEEFKV